MNRFWTETGTKNKTKLEQKFQKKVWDRESLGRDAKKKRNSVPKPYDNLNLYSALELNIGRLSL